MGSWDCHCALCCGPINLCGVDIAEEEVARDENDDDAEVIYSYSPALVSEQSIEWIAQCRAICYDPSTEATFISGSGAYDDHGFFEVEEPGGDPDDMQPDFYQCYADPPVEWGVTTFPFHEACYRVLAKRLGYDDPSEIDKYALCAVMRKFNNGVYTLGLDYAGVEIEQTWCARQGEEYLVTSPDDGGVDFGETIWRLLPSRLLLAEPEPDLTPKIQHDPFFNLTPDILSNILSHLPVKDTLNFMRASHHICTQTRHPEFWKIMIENHLTPWFWEVSSLIAEQGLIDHKGLFVWLDAMTTPRVRVRDPWLGVANRRRIWGVCGQLADEYGEALEREIAERGACSDGGSESEEEAASA